MKSTPSLSTYNRFDILSIDNIIDCETETPVMQNPKSIPCSETPPRSTPNVRRPKWERSLPEKFVIAATEGNPNSLKLKVEIETTDTAEKRSVNSIVDCGASGEFID